ncbi:MAG: hypothetical protein JXP34_03860, partial [Planctomycetes bacterium]|nr:hypothetical protein [Planctomycetota bacterium]
MNRCIPMALLLLGASSISARAGEVAIYTGNSSWVTKAVADQQAQICVDRLTTAGIDSVWYSNAADVDALADWVTDKTDDGEVDVLILFGYIPSSLYPSGNTQPDGSVVEEFVESEDGNAVINHGDWMFYVSNPTNGATGLQNIMDIPGISMSADDTPMVVTDEGMAISMNLVDFLSDRPFFIDQLAGEWFVEASLAQNAAGTRADPVVVRDGNRGRLIPIFQANAQADPMGDVAADVIVWLMERLPTQIALSASATTVTGTPVKLAIRVMDELGTPIATESPLTVTLASDSGTGAFDTEWRGPYNGSVTSVMIPEGGMAATVYYRDTSDGAVTLSISAPGLAAAALDLNVLPAAAVTPGEVAVYTGDVNWITKELADEQALICVDKLDLLAIPNIWFDDTSQQGDLADWMFLATNNKKLDVLVLYGYFPPTIYPAGNTLMDGSIAEAFIESTDGDLIINHADYMFYVSSPNNEALGLQNMMDVAGIEMGPDNTPMVVTDEGRIVAPSLTDFLTDRPLFLDQLAGDWFVEVSLAQNAAGTRADPVIVRDGNRGRLAPVLQANAQNDPKGAVAAEIIAWYLAPGVRPPTKIQILGTPVGFRGRPVKLTAEIQDFISSPSAVSAPLTVTLNTTSPMGAFDIAEDGSFDGTTTSVI